MGDDTATRRVEPALSRDVFLSHVEGVLDPAYRLATVILLDHSAAEGAVRDATLRAWGRYERLGGDVISFRTWFLAIVADHCRRVRRWRRLTLRGRGGDAGGPGHVLRRLSQSSRLVLFCHDWLGLPVDEVARVIGASPASVRGLVRRAHERVEEALDRGRDEEDEA